MVRLRKLLTNCSFVAISWVVLPLKTPPVLETPRRVTPPRDFSCGLHKSRPHHFWKTQKKQKNTERPDWCWEGKVFIQKEKLWIKKPKFVLNFQQTRHKTVLHLFLSISGALLSESFGFFKLPHGFTVKFRCSLILHFTVMLKLPSVLHFSFLSFSWIVFYGVN